MRSASRFLCFLLLLVACDPEKRVARLQGLDDLALPGQEVTLRAKLEKMDLLHLHPDLHGVPVVFEVGGQAVGTATTAREGIASLAWTPPGAGVHEVKASVAPGSKYTAEGTMRIFVREAKRPVLVVDLDGTICAGSSLDVIRKDPKDIPVLEGSPAALRRLAERFDVIYLTARDDGLIARSREWLDLHQFPKGPLLVRDIGLGTLSAEKHKTERLKALAKTWKLAAGVGDREEDGDAYLAAGMRALLVGEGRTPDGAHRYADWAAIEKALSEPRESGEAPKGPGGR